MTSIRAKCPSCGVVDLPAEDIALDLHPSGARGAFRFICPECTTVVDRPASRKTVALLLAAGVPVTGGIDQEQTIGSELPFEDWSPDPTARPFTLDDVIAFHFLLEDDVAIAEMLAFEH